MPDKEKGEGIPTEPEPAKPTLSTDEQAIWEITGQIKALNLGKSFLDVVLIQSLAGIKASKTYRVISKTWEGYCKYVGVPRPSADEWITNYHELGERLLRAAEQLMLPRTMVRAMRALPPEARPLVEGSEIVIGRDGDERRIPIESEYRQEIQLEIEKLQQAAAETRRVSEKTSRDLGREKEALNKQVDELLDKVEKLERSGAGEQLPDEAAELLKSTLDHSLRSLHAFQRIDLDALFRAPDAVGQAWQALKTNERICSDLQLILGRAMEEWDARSEQEQWGAESEEDGD